MKHVEALLRTLAERPDGLTSEETAEILGARTAKGIGSRLSEAKTWLRVGGIDWTEVADRRRTHSGLRWLAGLKIERALHTLSAYIENKPSEPVDAPYRGPAIVFRTLRIERSWDVFPHGVIDLPRQVDRSTPGTIHETVVERGEVHIERIENAPADRSAVPAGCGEHGEWVRRLYDDSPRLEPVDLEAMATEQVTVGFGVATVWEKRVALGSEPRGQLAAEQAFPGVDPEDGWHPVPDTPIHRYVRGLVINGRPVKVPPEVALRTCYRLTCMERGNNEERTLEALRGDAEARVTDYIRNEYVQHNRSWFVTYDDYGTIETSLAARPRPPPSSPKRSTRPARPSRTSSTGNETSSPGATSQTAQSTGPGTTLRASARDAATRTRQSSSGRICSGCGRTTISAPGLA